MGSPVAVVPVEPDTLRHQRAVREPGRPMLAGNDAALSLSPRDLILLHEAVRLIEDRAIKVQPSFAVTPETASVMAGQCRHLDGFRALTVRHIAAALDDRFRLLVARSRTSPARWQTLRATIDWSYDLLDAAGQIAFQQLSVFWRLLPGRGVLHRRTGRLPIRDDRPGQRPG